MEKQTDQSIFDALSPLVFRVFDFLLVGAFFFVGHEIRFNNLRISEEYQMLTLLSCFILVGSMSVFGSYASWRGKSWVEMLGRIIMSWVIAFVMLFALLAIVKKGEDFSRLWIGYSFALSCVVAMVARILIYSVLDHFRKRGFNQREVFIIGQQNLIWNLNEKIAADPGAGFLVKGAIDLELKSVIGPDLDLDSLSQLELALKRKGIKEVWVCLPLKESDFLETLLFALRHSTVNIRYVPDLTSFRLLNHKVNYLAGVSTLDLSSSPLDGYNSFVKRLEDLVLAILITLAVLPLAFVIAIAVRLSSPGPVIFKQIRLGVDGKPINIYKFRTMREHEDDGVKQARKDDDRVTRVGRLLRRTSMDELPQFYNVLQGRMSVVGPRPHAIAHNEHFKEIVESYMQRHRVKPGITGWAQVNGLRGETDTVEKMQKRVEHDLYYIDNWSVFFDIKIVVLTVFTILTDENAY